MPRLSYAGRVRKSALVLVVAGIVVACSKGGEQPDASSTASTVASTSPSTAPSAVPTPTASPSTAAPTADASTSCPSGMILVEGDYCTQVNHRCKAGKEWYAKWNDKHICTEFEEPKPGESNCVGKKEHKRFCMDEYEYPNKPGVRCTVMNDFYMAQRLCAEQSKRVCTETEWTTACEGPEYKPYPYGYVRDPSICRGDQSGVEPGDEGHDQKGAPFMKFASKNKEVRAAELERLWQGVPSGSEPKCVSDYGISDMAGNCDELAAAESPESKFDNVTTGGPWRYGVRNQCRPKIYTHNEGFGYYYESFRCCAEPDGQPTDPRAPKQIRRNEKWNGGKPAIHDSWDGDPFPETGDGGAP